MMEERAHESNQNVAASTLLLTPREAANRLRISPRSLWSLTKSGEVQCVRIGRSVRYSPDDLSAYVEARKAVSHG